MSKLDYLQQKRLNPGDELREILTQAEESAVKLKGMDSGQTLGLLQQLDQIDLLLQQVETAGLDVTPERGRFNALQAQLKQRAGLLLNRLGGRLLLAEHRPVPALERWWWYVDELAAAQRRRWLRQTGLIVLAIVVLVGGLAIAFQTVWAPAPEVLARLEAENKANLAINKGNYQQALAFVEQGLAMVPNDPSLLIFKGVIQQMLNQNDAADQSYSQAKAILGDPQEFYLTRAQLQLRYGRPGAAEADGRAILKTDENSARGWIIVAQALEWQEKYAEAMAAYQKAADLAYVSGENEIFVLARTAMARMTRGQ
jgi:tetratricopeptide (TPR) repeat protein